MKIIKKLLGAVLPGLPEAGAVDLHLLDIVSMDRVLGTTRVRYWSNGKVETLELNLDADSYEAALLAYRNRLHEAEQEQDAYQSFRFTMEPERVRSIERTRSGGKWSTCVGYLDQATGQLLEWYLPITLDQHNELVSQYQRDD